MKAIESGFNSSKIKCVTFGAPLVGNEAWKIDCAKYSQVQILFLLLSSYLG
jgi:hypothetical protein